MILTQLKKKVDLGINPRRNISFPSQSFALLLPVFALDVDNKYDQIYPGPKVVPLCRQGEGCCQVAER